ncbi:hypothetical protein [Silvibacterium dinghuense]|uniref:Uncharacterized protein n=1 Tax=Silvibacterium dinghuense TaxID=1560006 RepID=A0A4Q1S7U9_9BACT|nr:hypothetical protein [Silvibacterium dinghuense]RXS92995.1 hypothetical protein ESZ00_19340 [Silvibacterium dinghuense]
MAQAAVSLTKFYWSRSCNAVFMLLLFLQKAFAFGVMLLIPLSVLAAGSALQAQAQTASASASSSAPVDPDLPDAPSPLPAPQKNSQPNIPFLPPQFSLPLQPMDLGSKFKYFVEPAFGPRSFVTNAFGAGIRMANPPSQYPHEWRAGGEAFGRLYGDSFARTGAESLGRFSASALLHEDPRYRRSESTFFPSRLGHALAFTFIDRTDSGHTTVAISNFTGAAAGGFIGNAYLPSGFDNLTHAGQRSAIAFGGIAAQNVMQEFSPELGQFLKKIHLPHIPLPPVWWTGNNQ